jgi:hypothetical protein
VSTSSLRTTASDVERVVVGGRLVAERGRLLAMSPETTPERLLADALAGLAGSKTEPRGTAITSSTPDQPSQETQS